MRRKGFLLVEIIVGVVIFLIGVMALAASLAFSLKAVITSRETLPSDTKIENTLVQDLTCLMISRDVDPGNVTLKVDGVTVKKLTPSHNVVFTGTYAPLSFKFSLYRYRTDSTKYATTYYVIKRVN